MPIYEYQCQNCGEALEALQKMSDAPLLDCPACHQPALQKKISAAGFRLKGGGWYETDFKSSNKKNLAAGGGSDSSAPAKPQASSSETSAPAAKPPSTGSD